MIRVLLAVALLVGCKQAKKPPTSTDVILKVRTLATKICACPDRMCADALTSEWNGFTSALGGSGTLAGVELTATHVDALIVEDERVRKCIAKLAPAE